MVYVYINTLCNFARRTQWSLLRLTDVFFLRTSAIQASLMALGLSSVAEALLSFARFRVQRYTLLYKERSL
jgi:hypothetical protein